MKGLLATTVSVTWIVLCLALAGRPGPACGATGAEASRARPERARPDAGDALPAAPAGRLPAKPSPAIDLLSEVLPSGPEDPHLLRGRPPAGVMS